jgi:FolB domain-containing protein
MNEILIRALRVSVLIGVPDDERERAQELEIDIAIEPRIPFREMSDDITRTVDYAAVAARVRDFAGERPRCLIETLADGICAVVLSEFPARAVEVEIRKFILADTSCVAVRCRRERGL